MYSPLSPPGDRKKLPLTPKFFNSKLFIFIALIFTVFIFIETRSANEIPVNFEPKEIPKIYQEPVVTTTEGAEIAPKIVKTTRIPQHKLNPYRGYSGPKHELDDVEWETDSPRVNEISKIVQEQIYAAPRCEDSDSEPSESGSQIAKSAMRGFQECVKPIFDSFNGEFKNLFDNWVNSARKCDFIDEYKSLDIRGISNRDELKWLIYPKCQEQNHHVTLGVGHDVKAETKLKKHQPNTKFYGVDPMIEINYELIINDLNGSFFAFALSNETKLQYFPVLPARSRYAPQSVVTLDVGYFFEKLLILKKIDTLFLDIESGEEYFFDYFAKGGKFDEIGMTICQFNVEFHPGYTNNYKAYYKFLEQTIKDKRYIFLRPAHHNPGYFKMYFLNLESKECVRKFIGS